MRKSPNFQRPVYRATKPSMSMQYRIRQRSKLVYLAYPQCLGEAMGRGEDVLNSSELEDILGDTGGDDPGPLGASGMRTVTEPHLPVTLQGTVWGCPILFPQYPLVTGTTESLARMMAPWMAVATSLAHLTPSLTCPSPRP